MESENLNLQTFLDSRNPNLREICLSLIEKNLVHWCKGLVSRAGKIKELEIYTRENTSFPNWKYLKNCIKYNYSQIPPCPICGNPRSLDKGGTYFLKTCGNPLCVKEYIKAHNLKTYGVEWVAQSKEIKEKQKVTCVRRYGVPFAAQNQEIKEKIRNTNLQKYGKVCPMQNEEVKNHSRQNQIEKYGVPNVSMLEEIKKKKENTFLQHFGVKTSLLNPEMREKIKNINIERYGGDNPFKCKEIVSQMRRKYYYDNLYFDSSWEVAVYTYYKDQNIEIIYHPEPLEYNVGGDKHLYYPDFKIGEDLIEVKGDMMIDKEGNVIPHPSLIKEKGLFSLKKDIEAKNKCMRDNKIKVWTSKEISFYLNYVKSTHGSNFLKTLKT